MLLNQMILGIIIIGAILGTVIILDWHEWVMYLYMFPISVTNQVIFSQFVPIVLDSNNYSLYFVFIGFSSYTFVFISLTMVMVGYVYWLD